MKDFELKLSREETQYVLNVVWLLGSFKNNYNHNFQPQLPTEEEGLSK